MTERLYNEDSHRKEFRAVVAACEKAKDFWRVSLDRTAFFPEGGGQPADQGTLGEAHVLDAHEANRSDEEIEAMLARNITEDRVFGVLSCHDLPEFFDEKKLAVLRRRAASRGPRCPRRG